MRCRGKQWQPSPWQLWTRDRQTRRCVSRESGADSGIRGVCGSEDEFPAAECTLDFELRPRSWQAAAREERRAYCLARGVPGAELPPPVVPHAEHSEGRDSHHPEQPRRLPGADAPQRLPELRAADGHPLRPRQRSHLRPRARQHAHRHLPLRERVRLWPGERPGAEAEVPVLQGDGRPREGEPDALLCRRARADPRPRQLKQDPLL
mmetsp:Transcript_20340/g.48452  ORF Transcript_20340/g.48452 Transcript_20340/m.48452 type:complete len:207 (-) Transcript_20340:33-653(-)